MDLERIYAYLPIGLQNVAASIEGWRIARQRYSSEFYTLLADYESREFAACGEVEAYRDHRLRQFVRHAVDTVPYYRELFARLKLRSEEIRSLGDLEKLPLLTRDEVRHSPQQFVSPAVSRRACLMTHTSGTTGGGLRFPITWRAYREQWAVWWRYRQWHGLELHMPCCYFGGRSVVPVWQRRPPFWRYNRPGRQVLFSAYHLSPQTVRAYVDEVNRQQTAWIHGYPSVLAKFSALALEQNLRVHQVLWVTTGSENLFTHQAAIIAEMFGVWPMEHLGMAEAAANISQCPLGRWHVDDDFSAVEFVPDGRGGSRILGTNFSNLAFPLLRYDVGDTADIDAEPQACPCGRLGRVVAAIDGRTEDYVITKRGAWLGRLDHVFKDQVHVREAQIRQDQPGSIDILVVKGVGYTDRDERSLVAETVKRVGQEVDFRICYVETIPRSAAGKLQLVVSQTKVNPT